MTILNDDELKQKALEIVEVMLNRDKFATGCADRQMLCTHACVYIT